jgi:hypothetical protein
MEYNKIEKTHTCNLCNKNYASKSSLRNHNTKFHKKSVETNIKSYNCRICNKLYNNSNSRWKHEKICKQRKLSNNKIIPDDTSPLRFGVSAKHSDSSNLHVCAENIIFSKLLKSKEKEIQLRDEKIELYKNIFLKKQIRIKYPNNVIYMITTEDNELKRIYIIGRTNNLQNRLSLYNKTSEHKVIYYKECSREIINTIESIVLIKLSNYRERANRDRFILPPDTEINFFTNIIDKCINFFI